ncbi:MAG: hypothetical protein ABIQ95_08350, partial [Bdellovibrionia bacterium]
GDYSRKRMGELMISPILKVSLLEWAKGKKFTTLLSQKFLIQDFLMSKDIPNEQLKVNYSNILVSDPVEVSKGADVRIRIQWFANSICDESEFKLKIGDQIRLIKSK